MWIQRAAKRVDELDSIDGEVRKKIGTAVGFLAPDDETDPVSVYFSDLIKAVIGGLLLDAHDEILKEAKKELKRAANEYVDAH